jgi:minichromosome maintenance protein 10
LKKIETQLALKKAQKRKRRDDNPRYSKLQVTESPPPPSAVPYSPQRIQLGIDRGKKASEISLKAPRSATSPARPASSFAQKLASLTKETRRAAEIDASRARNKSKGFSPTALAAQLTAVGETETIFPEETDEWDQYTGFNLRRRILSQDTLREEIKGKTVYSVSDLYRLITPPTFAPPEYDTLDFLVPGIVASKSRVRTVKATSSNYLVIKLTDLKVPPPKSH